jgi:hypothetical protein
MALIAVAADKGSPGVTTSSVALAAVWPRPVLLAECDPAGGDLVYRLPAADGAQLDVRRGLLSLAVAARRGLQPGQVWEHTQKLHGGLDVLAGVTSAEQGAGLEGLWGPVGAVLSALPGADVIADCGRVGADGPFYDLLAQAAVVVLITRPDLGEVVRLRDRATAVAAALQRRGRPGVQVGVVVIAEHKVFGSAVAEIGRALADGRRPAAVLGGIALEPKSADQLRGAWGGRLDRSLLIRTTRQIAAQLSAGLPAPNVPTGNAAPGNSAVGDGHATPVSDGPPAPSAPGMRAASAPPGVAARRDRGGLPAGPDPLALGPDPRGPAEAGPRARAGLDPRVATGPGPRVPAGPDPRLASDPSVATGPWPGVPASAWFDPRAPAGPDPRRAVLSTVPSGESLSPLPSPDADAPSPRRRGRHAEPPREDALGPDPMQNGHGEPEPVSPRQPPPGEW